MAVHSAVRGSLATRQSRGLHWLRVALTYAAYLSASAIFIFPFLWAVTGSLKTAYELEVFPPRFLPAVPQWQNYVTIWEIVPLARYIWNTMVITTFSLLGGTLSGALVAYGFARFRFPGREVLFVVLLGTMMLPSQVTLIPTFVLFFKLHWIDTYLPLTVPSFFGGGALTVFLFRQFFRTVPLELDEAAKMDGASYLRIFFQVLLPVSSSVLLANLILGFLRHWNDFLHPLIFLSSKDKMTISVGLRILAATASAQEQYSGLPTTHMLMAASIVATLPPVLLYVVAQRHLVEGITLTGLKG
jgi:multiple sugar transport system permease protein